MLDEAALDAVSNWRFQPTIVNGQAVPVRMTVTVNFTLRKQGARAPVPLGRAWSGLRQDSGPARRSDA